MNILTALIPVCDRSKIQIKNFFELLSYIFKIIPEFQSQIYHFIKC